MKAERISENWCAQHLDHDGILNMIDGIHGQVGIKKPEVTVEEVNKDWKRLASFMQGKK